MAKRKNRVVGYAVTDGELTSFCNSEELARRKRDAWNVEDPNETPYRIVRLREVTPAEEAVLKAAREWVKVMGSARDGLWMEDRELIQAIERMEAEDE